MHPREHKHDNISDITSTPTTFRTVESNAEGMSIAKLEEVINSFTILGYQIAATAEQEVDNSKKTNVMLMCFEHAQRLTVILQSKKREAAEGELIADAIAAEKQDLERDNQQLIEEIEALYRTFPTSLKNIKEQADKYMAELTKFEEKSSAIAELEAAFLPAKETVDEVQIASKSLSSLATLYVQMKNKQVTMRKDDRTSLQAATNKTIPDKQFDLLIQSAKSCMLGELKQKLDAIDSVLNPLRKLETQKKEKAIADATRHKLEAEQKNQTLQKAKDTEEHQKIVTSIKMPNVSDITRDKELAVLLKAEKENTAMCFKAIPRTKTNGALYDQVIAEREQALVALITLIHGKYVNADAIDSYRAILDQACQSFLEFGSAQMVTSCKMMLEDTLAKHKTNFELISKTKQEAEVLLQQLEALDPSLDVVNADEERDRAIYVKRRAELDERISRTQNGLDPELLTKHLVSMQDELEKILSVQAPELLNQATMLLNALKPHVTENEIKDYMQQISKVAENKLSFKCIQDLKQIITRIKENLELQLAIVSSTQAAFKEKLSALKTEARDLQHQYQNIELLKNATLNSNALEAVINAMEAASIKTNSTIPLDNYIASLLATISEQLSLTAEQAQLNQVASLREQTAVLGTTASALNRRRIAIQVVLNEFDDEVGNNDMKEALLALKQKIKDLGDRITSQHELNTTDMDSGYIAQASANLKTLSLAAVNINNELAALELQMLEKEKSVGQFEELDEKDHNNETAEIFVLSPSSGRTTTAHVSSLLSRVLPCSNAEEEEVVNLDEDAMKKRALARAQIHAGFDDTIAEATAMLVGLSKQSFLGRRSTSVISQADEQAIQEIMQGLDNTL
ncbi:MAG: hypothetical protein ABI597_06445 [Gammaproteobacteria bacterium]